MRHDNLTRIAVSVFTLLGVLGMLGCASSRKSAFDPVEYSERYSKRGRTNTHPGERARSGAASSPKYFVYRDENGALNAVELRHRTPEDIERIQRGLAWPNGRPPLPSNVPASR
jgi:hypothetical protein